MNKKRKNSKKNSKEKNYITNITHKNFSLVNKLKCKKRNLTKIDYVNNNTGYEFEVKKILEKENQKIVIKNITIISQGEKILLFILTNAEFLIFETKNEKNFEFFLVKKFSKDFFCNKDDIIYYYAFKYNNKILFNFFSLKTIRLYLYDPTPQTPQTPTAEFILKKAKDYSWNQFSKYFYYLKKNNKFIIFKCDLVVIYDSLLTYNKTLISLEDNFKADLIKSCKELSINLLCTISSCSIMLFDLEKEKLIGSITEIAPKIVKIIEKSGKKYLMILSLDDINLYHLGNYSFIRKLNTEKIKNVKKIKQLPNLDIAITYGEYNIAIYDIKNNIIKYQIINKTSTNHLYKYFYLKCVGNNFLMYNPTVYCFHIINFLKGETVAKFSDGLKKIKKCKKINYIFSDGTLAEEQKNNFYLISNTNGYFVLKISRTNN